MHVCGAAAHHKSLSTDDISLVCLDCHCLPLWVLHNGVWQQIVFQKVAHIIMQRQLPDEIPCPV